jgi:hypothetical protein
MFHMRSSRNPGFDVRSWRDNTARPLAVAARLARELAAAERLPILAASVGDGERWHAETILKTVPVCGTRDGTRERVPARVDLRLDPEAQSLAAGETVWSDLAVEREDFVRYVAWLRSVW